MDGGRLAARGFLYQYQRTLEVVLEFLNGGEAAACRVEGDPASGSAADVDAIDFDIIDDADQVLLAVQVKSTTALSGIGPADVLRILDRLTAKEDAKRYQILTNGRVSQSIDNLVSVLCGDGSPDSKRCRLRDLLRSENARDLVASLPEGRFERLARCEVRTDDRSPSELRAALIAAVRRARGGAGFESGIRSGGLLLAYLLSEVHQRAAFPERSVWPVPELIRSLNLDDDSLLSLLGARDRGVVFGLISPVPDIHRADVLRQLLDAFPLDSTAARVPRYCQLVGLSGIGKSSMASAFIAEIADAYSTVFWVDSSSEDSILDGFRMIAECFDAESDDAEQLLLAVHKRLSSAQGRWLLILDDARIETIARYIPRHGAGDVLVTTIDSASKLRSAAVVEVPVMLLDEAVSLVSARFESDYDPSSVEGTFMRQLAIELDFWPLAIELASGYMLSCGYDIRSVPQYVKSLKQRSFADQQSVPFGYPRTLVAAIRLALDLVAKLEDPVVAEVASDVLLLCAYLAGRRVPLHLGIAARDPSIANLPAGSGPVIAEDPRVMEVLRSLIRVSFVRRDVDLPGIDQGMPIANVTFSINSVLQEVIRNQIESHSRFSEWTPDLDRLAYHLVIWISSAGHNGEADRARSLLPHCATLVSHFVRLGLGSQSVAVLMGNLANMYAAMHRRSEAVLLLQTELDFLESIPGLDDFLPSQVRLNLATALASHEYPTREECASAVSHLETILPYCNSLALDAEHLQQAATFCVRSLNVLDSIEVAGRSSLRSGQLADVYSEIMNRLPRTYEVDVRDALLRATALLSEGQYAAAEQLCLPLVAEVRYGTSSQLEARRMLLESYVGQEKWPEADAQLDAFSASAGARPVYHTTVEFALHNLGLGLVIRVLVETGASRSFFMKMMTTPCFRSAMKSAEGEYRLKFDIFSLVLVTLIKDDFEVRRLALIVEQEIAQQSDVLDNEAWAVVARVALRAASPAR